jgi:predicted dehydrogenase
VEKPLAASVEEGRQLVRAASAANRVVAVGHVERFNPAVVELKRRLRLGELGRLFYVEARRAGPFPPQIADVGVTVDLATHDLDVLSYLLNANPEIVFAQVARHVHGAHEDLLIGTLRYPHGVVASLHINWLTPTKVRQLAVTGEGGMMVVDYLTQDLTWYENSVSVASWDALDTLRGVAEGRMIRFPIGRREPLAAELEAFIAAISKSGSEIVTADQGLRALTLADCLLASARVSQPIRAPLESPDSSKATADAVLQTETSVSQSPGG